MATDELLLDRMRRIMSEQKSVWLEKKMFGGNCFMVDDKMCFGTYKGGLMVRIAPEEEKELVKRHGAETMVHGDRPMVGYLFVRPEGYDTDDDLEFWLKKCLEFNPRAKASKKSK
jgi:TfoX/Sxy family transcriptional regulator of competence genes